MTPLDPRLHAFRPDLADVNLKGQVAAERFVAPQLAWIKSPVAPLFKKPAPNLSRETEGLYGEPVNVFEQKGDYCWVQILSDGYVGYIATEDLSFTIRTMPTHYVHTRGSHMYPLPDLKSPPLRPLPFMAQLCVVGEVDGYAELENGRYVPGGHLTPISSSSGLTRGSIDGQDKILQTARSFLNTPYLWGGKSYAGIDCSGLVQLSFAAAGIKMLRDSDMQEKWNCGGRMELLPPCGGAVERSETEGGILVSKKENPSPYPLPPRFACEATQGKQGEGRSLTLHPADLLFWRGHVAIALDSENLIHANAHHMAVAIEPIQDAIARIAAKGDELRGVGRVLF